MMTRQDDRLLREVHFMIASGWALYARRADGADFVQRGSGSGISAGVHLVLLVITLGLWLPFLILVEVASSGGARYARLTFTPEGQPRYEMIKKPKRSPSYTDSPASHAVAHAAGEPCRCRW
jgi:hypothetical protein